MECDLFGEPIGNDKAPAKAPAPVLAAIEKTEEILSNPFKSAAVEIAGREILPDRSIRTTLLKVETK